MLSEINQEKLKQYLNPDTFPPVLMSEITVVDGISASKPYYPFNDPEFKRLSNEGAGKLMNSKQFRRYYG